jgi:hypothetical protein
MVKSQNTGPIPEEDRCTTKHIMGHQAVPPDLRNLPNPFIFSEHMKEITRGLDPGEAPPVVEGETDTDWLPDLATATVGMPKMINRHEVRGRRRSARLCTLPRTTSIWAPAREELRKLNAALARSLGG